MTFNEGSRLDPGRIQRRGRSSAGRGIAIGGGAGGIVIVVIVLVLSLVTGQDLTSILDETTYETTAEDGAAQESFDDRCLTGADANQYADCRVLGAVESLDVYWASTLPQLGVEYRQPGVVVFDGTTSSACGTASGATGPFYCPTDQTIYLDTTFFASLYEFGYEAGPTAEVYVVAHEYAHHIENLMGVFAVADRTTTGADSDTVRVELMADCLAGDWLGDASTTIDPDTGQTFLAPITSDQLDNALAAAESIGDDRIQETIQGEAQPHTFTHGTSEQRRSAVVHGYENGPASCDLFGVLGF